MDIDLKTKIKNITFNNPFINASGCYCYDSEELDKLHKSACSSIISKTCTFESRLGNEKPRYWHNDKMSINSMGLPNKGIDYYINYFNSKVSNKNHFISIGGLNLEENKLLLTTILKSYYIKLDSNTDQAIHAIEINLSCPNIKNHPQTGYDFNYLEDYIDQLHMVIDSFENNIFNKYINKYEPNRNAEDIERIKKDIENRKILIGFKLPPYLDVEQFKFVAKILNKYERFNFVTCINSIGNGLYIDVNSESVVIKPKQGLGGIGGSVVKPTALANVNMFYKLLKSNYSIIGCGGISSGYDVFEFILAGASMVSVGTELMRCGPTIFKDIATELREIMAIKGYDHIEDFKGKLKYL
mgnify:CR=1 FL=1